MVTYLFPEQWVLLALPYESRESRLARATLLEDFYSVTVTRTEFTYNTSFR